MYKNYGDVDFFEHGVLIDDEHLGTVFGMLLCEPYSDQEDLYRFASVQVDISDDWIDKKAVMDYIGMTEETFDPIQFAIGCTEYYSWDNFGADSYGSTYNWMRMTKEQIRKELDGYLITDETADVAVENDEWICTDPDSCQCRRTALEFDPNGNVFELIQIQKFGNRYRIAHDWVYLNDIDNVKDVLNSYGYNSIEALKAKYGSEYKGILAECVFELDAANLENISVRSRFETFEQAEAFIKAHTGIV